MTPRIRVQPWLFFACWATWLTVEYFAFGSGSYLRIHDNGDSFVPAKLGFARLVEAGGFPYWNSQWMGGNDTFSGLQAVCDLDMLLFLVLPGWLGYALVMWTQRFVAGYFMYRLATDSLGLRWLPSVLAALFYSLFSQPGFNESWAGFKINDGLTTAGLPLIFWGIDRIWHADSRWWPVLAAGLGVFFGLTSTYVFSVFAIALMPAWFFWVAKRSGGRFWGTCLLFVAGWLLSELPLVWAHSLNAPLSHRADWPVSSSTFSSYLAFARALAVDNILMLAPAAFVLAWPRLRDRRLAAVLTLAIVMLGILIGYPVARGELYAAMGFLAGFEFGRTYLLFPFLACISCAVALNVADRQRSNSVGMDPPASSSWRRLAPGAIVCVVLIVATVWQSVSVKRRTVEEMLEGASFLLYENSDLERLAARQLSGEPFRVATFGSHPAYAWAYGFETADGYLQMYPKRYQEYWEQVIWGRMKGDAWLYDYFHNWGNRVYLYGPASVNGDLRLGDYYDLDLLSLANVRYLLSSAVLHDDDLRSVPSTDLPPGPRSRVRRALADLLGATDTAPRFFVYENRLALPRFFLTGQMQIFDDSKTLLTALRDADLRELQSTVFLHRKDAAAIPALHGGGLVRVTEYTSQRISLDVTVEVSAVLVATNNYSPYWTARVDGTEARVFPADHAFQGLVLTAGRHEVELRYAPPYAVRLGSS